MSIDAAQSGDSSAASNLFGKTQRAVLGLLFCRSDEAFHVNDVVRRTGAGVGAVQRELGRLLRAGLVTRTRRGNLVLYQANRESPLYPALRELMVRTTGAADVLREALAPFTDRIRVAFIYGSMARGEEKAGSDVDLLVIGDVGFRDVVGAVLHVQDTLGREVNPTVYPAGDFQRRVAERSSFITTVLSDPKVFVIGDEDDLRGLAA